MRKSNRNTWLSIVDVVQNYGIIIAAETDCNYIVTYNSSYFNLWGGINGEDSWQCLECYLVGKQKDIDVKELQVKGEQIIIRYCRIMENQFEDFMDRLLD